VREAETSRSFFTASTWRRSPPGAASRIVFRALRPLPPGHPGNRQLVRVPHGSRVRWWCRKSIRRPYTAIRGSSPTPIARRHLSITPAACGRSIAPSRTRPAAALRPTQSGLRRRCRPRCTELSLGPRAYLEDRAYITRSCRPRMRSISSCHTPASDPVKPASTRERPRSSRRPARVFGDSAIRCRNLRARCRCCGAQLGVAITFTMLSSLSAGRQVRSFCGPPRREAGVTTRSATIFAMPRDALPVRPRFSRPHSARI